MTVAEFITIIGLCIAFYILGFLLGRAVRKTDGQLKVDTSGEKDMYMLELWCPLEGIEKKKSIQLKINDISNTRSQ